MEERPKHSSEVLVSFRARVLHVALGAKRLATQPTDGNVGHLWNMATAIVEVTQPPAECLGLDVPENVLHGRKM
eukprot:8564188-Alexandrium_andersonii.AAC.1